MDSPASKKSRVLKGSLRGELFEDEVVNSLKTAWTSSSNNFVSLKHKGVDIITEPFPVCVVENFINSSELLRQAASEVKDVVFHQKSNDLYQFKQSDDVRNLTNFTFITQLYDLIRVEGLSWVDKILGGNKLKQDISATFSSYRYEDRLLCHDDKCEDRHIAFILYLVEDWNEEDGGCLQLFNTDGNGYPSEIVKSVCPKFNSIVLFEVTHQSFHQVAEVKSKTKERLSLNGWFHSSGKRIIKPNCKILEGEKNFGNDTEFDIGNYFLSNYFDIVNRMDIKNIFLAESEIQLDEFIVPEFWDKIKTELKSDDLKWVFKGPANIRKYEVVEMSTLPPALQTLKEIFESKCWFEHLKGLTGLDMAPSETSDLKIWEKGDLPHCKLEIQRWTNSCYTLIHDQDPDFHSEGLDVILRIPFENGDHHEMDENKDDVPQAGHIIYIDADSKDEECLLHIGYKMNSLGLIFRDTKTLRFTKYLDSTAESFYQVFCTYHPWKPPLDEPHLRHCEESESDNSVDCEDLSGDDSS